MSKHKKEGLRNRRTISYIKQTRKIEDKCNICGRTRHLTWDHVPPRATLLNPNVYASTVLGEIPTPNRHMIRYQNGIKYRSICQECNGERLSVNDKELAKFIDAVANELASCKEENTIVVKTKINRVIRAVCGHFVSMKMNFSRKGLPDKQIREILFRSDKKLERLKLYCWFYPYSTICNVRDMVVIGKSTQEKHPKGMIGIMASFPLAFMISDKDEGFCGLDNLSSYMTKNIDEEVIVTLHLDTATYPGTRLLKHFYWPLNIENGPFSAGAVIGGKDLVEGSRIGVTDM